MFATKLAFGLAAALAFTAVPAFAADLMAPPAPAAAMTDSFAWDGAYGGVTGGYYGDNFWDIDGVVGVNFLPSEQFLLGVEGGLGWFTDGGSSGGEAYAGARAGFVVGPALLYVTGGEWINVPYAGSMFPYVGAGAEFAMGGNTSLRIQAVDYTTSNNWNASVGVLWHIH